MSEIGNNGLIADSRKSKRVFSKAQSEKKFRRDLNKIFKSVFDAQIKTYTDKMAALQKGIHEACSS